MGEDASLDDFLGSMSDEADPPVATTTYAWDGDGAACDACDERVERRWQQDGGLVCVECKDWERP